MPKYLLLLRDAGTYPELSPEAMQGVLQRYIDWTSGLASRGRLVDASKLYDSTGRVVRSAGGQPSVTDGPFVETKEVVGGYYIVEAATYEDAVALSSDCPHLDFGSIEIRELEAMRARES